jgi:hypothetical protein
MLICKAPQKSQHQQSQKYVRDSPNPLSHVPDLLIRNDRLTVRRYAQGHLNDRKILSLLRKPMLLLNLHVHYETQWAMGA